MLASAARGVKPLNALLDLGETDAWLWDQLTWLRSALALGFERILDVGIELWTTLAPLTGA